MTVSDDLADAFRRIKAAGETLDRLYAVVEAATALCENIRANGIHDNWKQLANALDALPEQGEIIILLDREMRGQ